MQTPQYITDGTGKKLSVILPVKEYNKIMDELDELDDIRLYDEAMSANEPSMPIDKAFELIEAKRKRR